LVLLLAAAPLHALAKITSGALLGMNRAWWVLGVNLIWSGVLLAVTAWLVPTRGVMGLSIAFLAAYAMLGTFSLASILVASKERVTAQLVPDTADHR
jgi:O-antigen/teichoic acid export membrane protein